MRRKPFLELWFKTLNFESPWLMPSQMCLCWRELQHHRHLNDKLQFVFKNKVLTACIEIKIQWNIIQNLAVIYSFLNLTNYFLYKSPDGRVVGGFSRGQDKKKLEAIHFVNSVCTIFNLRKQGTPHQTFPSQPELTSAVSLRKQGTVYKTNGLQRQPLCYTNPYTQ